MRMLGFGVLFVGLMSTGRSAPAIGASFAREVVVPGQSADTIPVDVVLAKRWSELFAAVIRQFHREDRDLVGNLEGDFTTREIKVRATSEGDVDSLWVSRTLSEQELRTADLDHVASDIYMKAKARAGIRSPRARTDTVE